MATLKIIGEETSFPLELSQVGIGRAFDNEIAIDDESVSAFHALITIAPNSVPDQGDSGYTIEDLESTNKTVVNGRAITRQPLKDGDIIRVGETRLKFSLKDNVPQHEFQKTKKLNKKTVEKYLLKK